MSLAFSRQKGLVPWIFATMVVAVSSTVASAGTLPQPDGRVVLTVTGSITNTNDGGAAEFDMAMLESLPTIAVETTTPWTEGVTKFEGVLVRDVLAQAGANGVLVNAVALNDYRFEIPVSDFNKYPVILAYKTDNKQLRIRDKGPLWIVYPLDGYEELRNEQTHSKMVWQLRRLVIQ